MHLSLIKYLLFQIQTMKCQVGISIINATKNPSSNILFYFSHKELLFFTSAILVTFKFEWSIFVHIDF